MKRSSQIPEARSRYPFLLVAGLPALLATAFLSTNLAAAITPIYQTTSHDYVWQNDGDDFKVEKAANDYDNEIFELAVDGDKYNVVGDYLVSTDKYYAHSDLKTARWGTDGTYLFASWEVVGEGFWLDGSQDTGEGYGAHYYAYFGVVGEPDIVLTIAGGKGDELSTSFDPGTAAELYRDTDGNVPGSNGINPDPGAGTGFDVKVDSAEIHARRVGATVEMALDLSSVGFDVSDVALFDYVRFATAVSNPSSVGDLFVNDHFDALYGHSLTIDTVGEPSDPIIPEPSPLLLLLPAFCVFIARRRKP